MHSFYSFYSKDSTGNTIARQIVEDILNTGESVWSTYSGVYTLQDMHFDDNEARPEYWAIFPNNSVVAHPNLEEAIESFVFELFLAQGY